MLMRKFLLAGFLGLFALLSLPVSAGEPTTMWPYLFDDFTEATLYFRSQEKGMPGSIFICCATTCTT